MIHSSTATASPLQRMISFFSAESRKTHRPTHAIPCRFSNRNRVSRLGLRRFVLEIFPPAPARAWKMSGSVLGCRRQRQGDTFLIPGNDLQIETTALNQGTDGLPGIIGRESAAQLQYIPARRGGC